jgi:hypothetical protein
MDRIGKNGGGFLCRQVRSQQKQTNDPAWHRYSLKTEEWQVNGQAEFRKSRLVHQAYFYRSELRLCFLLQLFHIKIFHITKIDIF